MLRMPEKLPTTPVRGMRDLLPQECALRDAATAAILSVYRSFGFARIETPALEHLELLASGQGGENEKLIFKILRRGEKLDLAKPGLSESDLVDAGLRFDLTVPLARYYAEHQAELPLPFKSIQIGPVWRAERPQKGRYRQFTQCDIDVLGDGSVLAEVELILATCAALQAVGLSGFTVRLNDRRFLQAFATHCKLTEPADRERLFITLDKLDKLGLDGVVAELEAQGLGGVHLKPHLEILASAGRQPDPFARFAAMSWAAESLADLRTITSAATAALGSLARVQPDFTLVRGMGYYTGPIFEIGIEGSPGSLAGGGRYDEMIGRMLGRAVPACGFSIGFERLMLVLAERGWRPAAAAQRIALLHDPESGDLARTLAEAARLRAAGAVVSVLVARKKAGKQRADLEAQGFLVERLGAPG
ncbi:MAG: histidine--tRNA ligase [Planctomycetota bacterium]